MTNLGLLLLSYSGDNSSTNPHKPQLSPSSRNKSPLRCRCCCLSLRWPIRIVVLPRHLPIIPRPRLSARPSDTVFAGIAIVINTIRSRSSSSSSGRRLTIPIRSQHWKLDIFLLGNSNHSARASRYTSGSRRRVLREERERLLLSHTRHGRWILCLGRNLRVVGGGGDG